MRKTSETVLVTGGSGFLGQHIIKMLALEQENLGINEIRSLDIVPYYNNLEHFDFKNLVTFVGDISKPEMIEEAFEGVDCVFHCAAYVGIEIPSKSNELERINVNGTKNVIDLCIKYNISRLIYTSCASVAITPYMGHSTFAVVINQTESKALTPLLDMNKPITEFDKEFLIRGYSSTKLRAERMVLSSSGTTLSNGLDFLQTVAIRPPLMYGEADCRFMPSVLKYLAEHNMKIPRIAGSGGKQQVAYVGNVAWGHLCAYKTLKCSPKKIDGLPVFITDDSPVNDISRFIQRIGLESQSLRFQTTSWSIPHFIFYFIAFLLETFIYLTGPILKIKLKYSPRAIASFTASVIMFNRLRSSIHLDYEPLFDEKKSLLLSANWYEKWFYQNIGSKSECTGK